MFNLGSSYFHVARTTVRHLLTVVSCRRVSCRQASAVSSAVGELQCCTSLLSVAAVWLRCFEFDKVAVRRRLTDDARSSSADDVKARRQQASALDIDYRLHQQQQQQHPAFTSTTADGLAASTCRPCVIAELTRDVCAHSGSLELRAGGYLTLLIKTHVLQHSKGRPILHNKQIACRSGRLSFSIFQIMQRIVC